jgi:hypothetical protein
MRLAIERPHRGTGRGSAERVALQANDVRAIYVVQFR